MLDWLIIKPQVTCCYQHNNLMVAKAIFLKWCISANNLDNQNEASPASAKAKASATIILLAIWRTGYDCHTIGDNFPVLSLKNIRKLPQEPLLTNPINSY